MTDLMNVRSGAVWTPGTKATGRYDLNVEASTAGLAPGQWPEAVRWEGVVFTRENDVVVGGELAAVIYTNDDGIDLYVWND